MRQELVVVRRAAVTDRSDDVLEDLRPDGVLEDFRLDDVLEGFETTLSIRSIYTYILRCIYTHVANISSHCFKISVVDYRPGWTAARLADPFVLVQVALIYTLYRITRKQAHPVGPTGSAGAARCARVASVEVSRPNIPKPYFS